MISKAVEKERARERDTEKQRNRKQVYIKDGRWVGTDGDKPRKRE